VLLLLQESYYEVIDTEHEDADRRHAGIQAARMPPETFVLA